MKQHSCADQHTVLVFANFSFKVETISQIAAVYHSALYTASCLLQSTSCVRVTCCLALWGSRVAGGSSAARLPLWLWGQALQQRALEGLVARLGDQELQQQVTDAEDQMPACDDAKDKANSVWWGLNKDAGASGFIAIEQLCTPWLGWM